MKYLFILIICILVILLITKDIPVIKDISSNNYIEMIKEDYQNENIIGYLKISDLETPIVKSNDNSYYLNHNIYNQYDIKGSIFLDNRTSFNDKIAIIYGHSSETIDVPFNYLSNYYNEYFFQNNNIINIYTSEEIEKYLIFAVFIEYQDWFYLNINADYQEYLNKIKNKSWFETKIDVNTDDKILIIQTCSFHHSFKEYPKKYLLIVSKKIKN